MSILDGIAALLWANAAFRDASSGGLDFVRPPEIWEGVHTTYQRVGGSSAQNLTSIGLQKLRVQFDFRGPDGRSCEAAHLALRTVLEQYSGPLSNGFMLQNAIYLQPIDFLANDSRRFRVACEFYLIYLNPNPVS